MKLRNQIPETPRRAASSRHIFLVPTKRDFKGIFFLIMIKPT